MAGIIDQADHEIRTIFVELYNKLQDKPAKQALDVSANLAALVISLTTEDPAKREEIVNDLAKNVKILLRERYSKLSRRPEVLRP